MADYMPGTLHAYFSNPHYYCAVCGRDLWGRRRRLKNPHHCPAVFVVLVDGQERELCERCFHKATAPEPKVKQLGLF